jgi:chaperone required for assembly of F1-ATPase
MKRFYEKADAIALADEPGYGISIDGKTLRTPAQRTLILPTPALAEAIDFSLTKAETTEG